MTHDERDEMDEAIKDAMEWFGSLTPEQRVEHLKKIGILSPDGRLSGRYGGPGEWVEPPDPRFKWIPEDEEPAAAPEDETRHDKAS